MAISPIGGMIYANQNMQNPATQQAEFQQRLDAQSTAAMAASQEEKKEIEEVRPTEEALELDPEKDQEQQASEEEDKGEESQEGEDEMLFARDDEEDHLLDIKI